MQENELSGTFDASQLTIVLGVLPVTGLSDGDAVTVRRTTPRNYTSKAGMKGAVGRSRNTDKRGEIEIRVLQTAGIVDAISAMSNLDSLTVDGKAVFPITCVDLSGRTVISAGQAWLAEVGDIVFNSGAVSDRIFTFECADLKYQLGGNNV